MNRLLLIGMILVGLVAAACSSSGASDTATDPDTSSGGSESVSSGVASDSGTSVLIDDLRAQRMRSASVALPDGRVLVTGGNQP